MSTDAHDLIAALTDALASDYDGCKAHPGVTERARSYLAAQADDEAANEQVLLFLMGAHHEALRVLRNLMVQVCQAPGPAAVLEHVAETIDGMEMHGDAELMAAYRAGRAGLIAGCPVCDADDGADRDCSIHGKADGVRVP